MLKRILGIIIVLILAAAAAQAIVLPVKSAIHPVHETLFVPYNYNWDQGKIKVYTRSDTTWDFNKNIPLYGRVHGLAASGDKLYAAIAKAEDSRLIVFSLDSAGIPTDFEHKDFSYTGPSLSPAEVIVDPENEKVYVADAGGARIHIHDLEGNSIGAIIDQLAGKTNLFGLAFSEDYLFVSRKNENGEIYCFKRGNNDYVRKITDPELNRPTYMKVVKVRDEEKLIVAVNSYSSQVDILVFDVETGKKTGGLLGATEFPAGWTGFDITPDGKYILYTQYYWHSFPGGPVIKGVDVYVFPTNDLNAENLDAVKVKNYAVTNYNGLVIAPDKRAVVLNHADERNSKLERLIQFLNDFEGDDYYQITPELESIAPDTTYYASNEIIQIQGKNFIDPADGGFEVYIEDSIAKWRQLSGSEVIVENSQRASAQLIPEEGYAFVPGVHSVKVVNNFGGDDNFAESNELSLTINFTTMEGVTQDVHYAEGEQTRFVGEDSFWLKWDSPLEDPGSTPYGAARLSYTILYGLYGEGVLDQSHWVGALLTDSISGLIPNTKYDARIRADSNDPDVFIESETATAYTFTNLYTPDPCATAEINADNQILITWDNDWTEETPGNPDYTEYEIGRKVEGEEDYTVIATQDADAITPETKDNDDDFDYRYIDNEVNNPDNPPQPNVPYYYAVRALNKAYFDDEYMAEHQGNIPRHGAWDKVEVDGDNRNPIIIPSDFPIIDSIVRQDSEDTWAYVYDTIVINGSGFLEAPGTVSLDGNQLPETQIYSWTPTRIEIGIPRDVEGTFIVAGDSQIVVTADGQSSDPGSFEIRPKVYSVTPNSGPIGTSVDITGTALGTDPDNVSVDFNGGNTTPSTTPIQGTDNDQFTVTVPPDANSGQLLIFVNTKQSNTHYDWDPFDQVIFTVTPGPIINSIVREGSEDTWGYVYDTIVINGSGFLGAPGTVSLDGNQLPETQIYSWTPTRIEIGIPRDVEGTFIVAGDSQIVVAADGQSSDPGSFEIRPKVYSVVPDSGPIGTDVTITGTAFGPDDGNISVDFNGGKTPPSTPPIQGTDEDHFTVAVPDTAQSGQLLVRVNNIVSNANYDWDPFDQVIFTVTPGPIIDSIVRQGSTDTWGYVYDTIVINGSGFSDVPGDGQRNTLQYNVTIDGITVPDVVDTGGDDGIQVYSWADNEIILGIPKDDGSNYIVAGDLPVIVTTNGFLSDPHDFEVRPKVYGIDPNHGEAEDSFTITGTAFGADPNNVSVNFNSGPTQPHPDSVNNTELTVTVPQDANSGQLLIFVNTKQSNTHYDWDPFDQIVFTLEDLPPAAPRNLDATLGNGYVDLDWRNNSESDFDHYEVYRSDTSGGPYSQINGDVADSEYRDDTVENGNTYYYVVIAVDDEGNPSDDSNEAEAVYDFSLPMVNLIYPNKAPNDIATNIVIEGTEFVEDAVVQIHTMPTPTELTVTNYVGSTRIYATVPSGLSIGTYQISVTNPAGTSPSTPPNDQFEVIAPGSDIDAPDRVQNASATAVSDTEINISWTNPADTDLYTIVVRRSQTAYPQTVSEGDPVDVSSEIGFVPQPGVTVNFSDTGLSAGTQYFYSIFAGDTSGNINDSLAPPTIVGENAANATTTGGGPSPISNLRIVRDGDVIPSSVTVFWDTNPADMAVDVWVLERSKDADGNYTDYFTTDPTDPGWTRVALGVTIGTHPDGNQVGQGTARYYKIVPADDPLGDLTSDVVAKFDMTIRPGSNLISIPLIPTSTDLDDVIGEQLFAETPMTADRIYYYDASIEDFVQSYLSSIDGKWSKTQFGDMEPDKGYYIGRQQTQPTCQVTVVGNLFHQDTRSIDLYIGSNMIGTTYPISIDLNGNIGLKPVLTGNPPATADKVYYYDSGTGNWVSAYLPSVGDFSGALTHFEPGKGYYVTNQAAALEPETWSYTKP